jgi:hypothetical protein
MCRKCVKSEIFGLATLSITPPSFWMFFFYYLGWLILPWHKYFQVKLYFVCLTTSSIPLQLLKGSYINKKPRGWHSGGGKVFEYSGPGKFRFKIFKNYILKTSIFAKLCFLDKFSFLLRNRQYKVAAARSYLRVPILFKSNMAAKAGKPCPGSMLFEININLLA